MLFFVHGILCHNMKHSHIELRKNYYPRPDNNRKSNPHKEMTTKLGRKSSVNYIIKSSYVNGNAFLLMKIALPRDLLRYFFVSLHDAISMPRTSLKKMVPS